MHSEADAKFSSLWEGKQFYQPAFNTWFMLAFTALSLLQKKCDYRKYIDKVPHLQARATCRPAAAQGNWAFKDASPSSRHEP